MTGLNEDGNIGLFSNSEEDQVRSPEKLNEYIRIATPGTWILVVALAAVLAALIVWGNVGRIPVHLSITGVGMKSDFVNTDDVKDDVANFEVNTVICFVDSKEGTSHQIQNKRASVVFRDGTRVGGEAHLLDTSLLQDEEIHDLLDSLMLDTDWIFAQLGEGTYRYPVYVELDKTLDYLYYGETADVAIIVDEVKPFSFLFD